MKNFNRRSSHGHHGSKHRELVQLANSRGSHARIHSLTHLPLILNKDRHFGCFDVQQIYSSLGNPIVSKLHRDVSRAYKIF